MEQEKVQIQAFVIKNFKGLGIEEAALEFDDLGNINLIKGPNESGKTRLLDAISFSLTDGARKAWIRTDDEGEAEVLVQFSNGHRLKKRVTDKGIDVTLKDKHGRPLDKSWSSGIVGDLGLDIGKFLDPKGWDYRRQTLLKSAGIAISIEEIETRIGNKHVPRLNEDSDLFYKFAAIEKFVRECRRDAGVALKQNEATIAKLQDTIADADIDPQKFAQKKADAVAAREKVIAQRDNELKQYTAMLNKDIQKTVSTIEKLKADLAAAEKQLAWQNEELKNLDQKIIDAFAGRLTEANSALTELEEQGRRAASVAANKETLSNIKKQAADSESEKAACETALQDLKNWQKEIVDAVGIKGIAFPDGEQDIFLDEVPWASANTAKQISVAIKVAEGLCKQCPIILLDNAEHLDDATKYELFVGMKKAGVQAFLAEVDPNPVGKLRVEKLEI